MALWARVQYLPEDAKQDLCEKYSDALVHMEVREFLAIWIEENILNNDLNLNPQNPEHLNRITSIEGAFINEIQRVESTIGIDTSCTRAKLRRAFTILGATRAVDVFMRIVYCLKEELRLVQAQTTIWNQNQNQNQNQNLTFDAAGRTNEVTPPGDSSSSGSGGSERLDRPNAAFVDMSSKICHIVHLRNKWTPIVKSMQKKQTDLLDSLQSRKRNLELLERLRQQPIIGMNGAVNSSQEVLQNNLAKLDGEIQNRTRQFQELESKCIGVGEKLIHELNDLVEILVENYLGKLRWSELNDPSVLLDDVHKWYNELLETISATLRALQNISSDAHLGESQFFRQCHLQPVTQSEIRKFEAMLDQLFTSMIANSLFPEEPPPPIVSSYSRSVHREIPQDEQEQSSKKTKSKVKTVYPSVRLFPGEKFLPPSTRCQVKVAMITEKQAAALARNGRPTPSIYKGCKEVTLTNICGTNLGDTKSSRLSYQFNKLKVTRVKGDKETETRVITDKYCFLYFTKFELNGKPFEVWCCSTPFTFIVHASQIPKAWAPLFWDDLAKQPNRVPLAVPEKAPWAKVAVALNSFFKEHSGTSWNLSPTNIRYLGEKIFGSTNFGEGSMVQRAVFFDDKDKSKPATSKKATGGTGTGTGTGTGGPGGKEETEEFGFWDWFYACIVLTKKHLVEYFDKGYIVGFINRCRDAEERILSQEKPGTFIIRFSDSNLGALSISYICLKQDQNDPSKRNRYVESIRPLSDKQLLSIPLINRINDDSGFHYVYHYTDTNDYRITPKSEAFPLKEENGAPEPGPSASAVQAGPLIGVNGSGYVLTRDIMRRCQCKCTCQNLQDSSSTDTETIVSSSPVPVPEPETASKPSWPWPYVDHQLFPQVNQPFEYENHPATSYLFTGQQCRRSESIGSENSSTQPSPSGSTDSDPREISDSDDLDLDFIMDIIVNMETRNSEANSNYSSPSEHYKLEDESQMDSDGDESDMVTQL